MRRTGGHRMILGIGPWTSTGRSDRTRRMNRGPTQMRCGPEVPWQASQVELQRQLGGGERNGLMVMTERFQANGAAERHAALVMLGADSGCASSDGGGGQGVRYGGLC